MKTNHFAVVEKKNHNAVHCLTWSHERAQRWIDAQAGITPENSHFDDKTLTADSFEILAPSNKD